MERVPHPGEVLKKEFLIPLRISVTKLAKAIHVHPQSIYNIVRGDCGISPRMAIRLGVYFNTDPEYLVGLNAKFKIQKALERVQSHNGKHRRIISRNSL